MKTIRNYFIGKYLNATDDVFEQARAIMLLRFTLMFVVVFMIPLASDVALGYEKAVILHGFDALILFTFPFIIKHTKKLDNAINFFFIVVCLTSFAAAMMFTPLQLNVVGVAWLSVFIFLGALLMRGVPRILYCGLFGWCPIFYPIINGNLNGAISWHGFVQEGAEEPPVFLMFIPILLFIYAIISHTSTIQIAKERITEQKALLETKNKDITDSIHYAKRIQTSLLPTKKYIDKNFKRLNN